MLKIIGGPPLPRCDGHQRPTIGASALTTSFYLVSSRLVSFRLVSSGFVSSRHSSPRQAPLYCEAERDPPSPSQNAAASCQTAINLLRLRRRMHTTQRSLLDTRRRLRLLSSLLSSGLVPTRRLLSSCPLKPSPHVSVRLLSSRILSFPPTQRSAAVVSSYSTTMA